MSNVSNFTPEELNLIREIIPLTGFAVAVAGNSGIIGTLKKRRPRPKDWETPRLNIHRTN